MRQLISRSLRLNFMIMILIVVVVPILGMILLASIPLAQIVRQRGEQALENRAELLAESVTNWDESIILGLKNMSVQPGIVSLDPARQQLILQRMTNVYKSLSLAATTDLTGLDIAQDGDEPLRNYQDRPWFQGAAAGSDITRQVLINRTTGQPSVNFSAPIRNDQAEVIGVIRVSSNIDVVTNQVGAIRLGDTGFAYVVNELGQVLAHPNTQFVAELQDRSTYPPVQNVRRRQSGLIQFTDSDNVHWFSYTIPLENGWGVVVQQHETEVLAQVRNFWQLAMVVIVLILVAVGTLTWLVIGRLTQPIVELTSAATALADDHLNEAIVITRNDEVGLLATAFNSMAEKLRQTIDGLEQTITERTRGLEIVAVTSEKITTVLNFDELLVEIVNQVKEGFAYYHTHIYLLDENKEQLIVAAGTGKAGETMVMTRHKIPLNAKTSLVAQAARTKEIVMVDNVRERSDWLPNDLLPETHSEMAVPIILEGETVGVLDVQENKPASFDKNDANLMRSLASQVAGAIRNAELFEEVQAALVDLRISQEHYAQEAWQARTYTTGNTRHLYSRTAAVQTALEPIVDKAHAVAVAANEPSFVHFSEMNSEALVAPIHVQGVKVGGIQIHTDKIRFLADEDNRLIMEAVLAQLGQTAENLRLFEETRERASREQLIGQVSEKLRQAPNMEALMQTGISELTKALGVDRAYVRLDIPAETAQNDSNVKPMLQQQTKIQNRTQAAETQIDDEIDSIVATEHETAGQTMVDDTQPLGQGG